MSPFALFALAVVLVLLGGMFAGVDAALITVSKARVEELVKQDQPGAQRLLKVVENRPRHINVMVLLRIACEVAAAMLAVGGLIEVTSPLWALVIAGVIMVLAYYIVIGVAPRTVGRQHAYGIALAAAAPLQVLGSLLGPVPRLLISFGNALTPGKGFREGPFDTEIELREMVDMAGASGVVDDDERRMIQSVFDLGDTPAREVMVPRTDMVWIEAGKNAGQATNLAVRSGHSRIPVVGENVDDVVGIVYLKDLVQRTYSSRDAGAGVLVSEVMRPAVFVPDGKPLDALLEDMQRTANHMVVLVDEYGAVAGLVTLEDIIEEIVGEIADEYDQDEIPPVQELPDGSVRVSARLPVEDLGEIFGVELSEDDVDTVGGLMGFALGRVPLPGSHVQVAGLELVGEAGRVQRGRVRISTVLVRRADDE